MSINDTFLLVAPAVGQNGRVGGGPLIEEIYRGTAGASRRSNEDVLG